MRAHLSLAPLLLAAACTGGDDREFGTVQADGTQSAAIGNDLLVVVLDTSNVPLVEEFMPNTSEWLQGARRHRQARTPSNSTVESTASLFLDTWAQRQAVLSETPAALPLDLRAAGYSSVLASANDALDQPWFRDGFDESWIVDSESRFPDADAIDAFAARWAALPSPRFGWIQLAVGHDYRSSAVEILDGGWADDPSSLAAAYTAWGADAAETDTLLPELFALNTDGVTAITSDHGELFGQYGSFLVPGQSPHGHGLSSSAWETRVELAFAGPGIEPALVDGAVTTVDLHPTLLHLAGAIDEGPNLLTGEGLRPAVVSICMVGDDRNPEHWLSALVRDDGSQLVHTSANQGLPAWLNWSDDGAPGLSTAWTEINESNIAAAERTMLAQDLAPQCVGDSTVCEDEDLAALGYTECP